MFNSNNPNQEVRSLLQKAVRRGQAEIVKACRDYLIKNGDLDWLHKRASINRCGRMLAFAEKYFT